MKNSQSDEGGTEFATLPGVFVQPHCGRGYRLTDVYGNFIKESFV